MIIGFLWSVFMWLCGILGGLDLVHRATHSADPLSAEHDRDPQPRHISTIDGLIIILLSIVGILVFGLWSGMKNSR